MKQHAVDSRTFHHVSGFVLMLEGASRNPQVTLIHKASFFIWITMEGRHDLRASIGAVKCDCFAARPVDRRVQGAARCAAARLECGVGAATRA